MATQRSLGLFSRSSVGLFLALPFLVLLYRMEGFWLLSPRDLWRPLSDTVVQSSLSALFSVLLGWMGAMGLLARTRSRQWIEGLLLIPNFLPVLFVLIAALQIFNPFPFGFLGVVLIHVVLNAGLVAVMMAHTLELRLGKFAEVAQVQGAGRWAFWSRIGFPLLRRDLGLLFLYVFAICFSSFATPLIAGGGHVRTLEVFIYEKFWIESQASQAFGVSIIQFLLLLGLSAVLVRRSVDAGAEKTSASLLGVKWFDLPLLVLTGLILGSDIMGLAKGLIQLQKLQLGALDLIGPSMGTLAVGLGTGVLTGLVLTLVVAGFPHSRFETLLRGYIAPSTALTGIGFLYLGTSSLADQTKSVALFKIAAGVTLLSLGALFRMRLSGTLESLRSQMSIAKTLGASEIQILRRVLLPQALPDVLFLAGVSAFWATGDFAYSSLISGENSTVALLIDDLLGTYRLEAAAFLSWWSVLLGFLCFGVFWRLSYVARQRTL